MVTASIFWDGQDVIMVDYNEAGRMINGAYYAEELRRLRQEIASRKLTYIILTPLNPTFI